MKTNRHLSSSDTVRPHTLTDKQWQRMRDVLQAGDVGSQQLAERLCPPWQAHPPEMPRVVTGRGDGGELYRYVVSPAFADGVYGTIRLARDLGTGRTHIVKEHDLGSETARANVSRIQREYAALRASGSPLAPKNQWLTAGSMYVVMEQTSAPTAATLMHAWLTAFVIAYMSAK